MDQAILPSRFWHFAKRSLPDSSQYLFALMLPPTLLLQRQNWALPNTGLGSGLGIVSACLLVGATVTLFAAGTHPTSARAGPLPALMLLWICLVYASYFTWALAGNRIAPMLADLTLAQLTLEIVFVLGLMSALRTETHLLWFVKILVLCGGVYGALLLITAATGQEVVELLRVPILEVRGGLSGVEAVRAGFIRPQGMAGHPLESGSVAAALVPLGLGLSLGIGSGRKRTHFWLAVVGITALGAISTMSRSATIALVTAFCCMGLRWPLRRIVRVCASTAGALLAAVVLMPDRFGAYLGLFSLSASSDSSLFSREQAREHVARVMESHFWTGEGMGTQAPLRQPILDNQYLGFAVEMGVPVMIAFILLLVVPIYFCLQRSATLPERQAQLALGLAGSLSALAVIFAVLDAFGFPQIRLLTYIMLALVGPACASTGHTKAQPTTDVSVTPPRSL